MERPMERCMMSKIASLPLAALSRKTVHPLRLLLFGALLLIFSVCADGATADDIPVTSEAALAGSAGVRAFSLDPQPMVSLSFDDASQSVYDTAFPILSSRGIPATFYFMTSGLNEQWKAELKDLENHGWEIASHSRTHPDLTVVSDADLIEEVSQSKAVLEDAGLRITGFAYPYGTGSDSAAVVRQVKQHYSYARSVNPGNNAPIIQQYALKTQTVMRSTSQRVMRGWVDSAIKNRQWLVIVMHNVDNTKSEYAISPADLAGLTSYIQTKVEAGALKAVTVRDGVTRYSQTDWHAIDDLQPSTHSDIVITNDQVLWYLGSRIADYLNDGYEWVESGELRYYELNGDYQTINVPNRFALESIRPDHVTAEITLGSVDGAASVDSTITLVPGSPLAEIRTTDVRGTPEQLSLAKEMTRRFSVDDGLLVTDGSLETELRTYGDAAQSFFAFDQTTDLVRIMTDSQPKSHSEYADYTRGEFRSSPISVTGELPHTWFVGGIVFDTHDLLAEAENGIVDGQIAFYKGLDASPGTGATGVRLDNRSTVSMRLTPPARGNYILSIRHKGISGRDQYRYQIDGGEVFTRTVAGARFGYHNIALPDLSAQSHTVKVSAASGRVVMDYALLVPTSRSANTPATVRFPADVARKAHDHIMLQGRREW
jgi:peptidoglycan/xylan/chitin deacetylase (PgdA/CDA1 family)